MRSFLLKPSLIPTVSIFGLDFAATMGNAFLVELIFNWPGISRYGINAMLRKDLNAIAAVIMILGVVFIIVNIFVDLTVAQLDPRIRLAPTGPGVRGRCGSIARRWGPVRGQSWGPWPHSVSTNWS